MIEISFAASATLFLRNTVQFTCNSYSHGTDAANTNNPRNILGNAIGVCQMVGLVLCQSLLKANNPASMRAW